MENWQTIPICALTEENDMACTKYLIRWREHAAVNRRAGEGRAREREI